MTNRFNHSQAIADVMSGMTMSEVGRRHGVSRERIRQIVRKANVTPRCGRDNRQALRDQVTELVLEGLDDAAVAARLGLTVLGVASDRRSVGLSEAGHFEHRLDAIRSGVEAGCSIRQIALRLGIRPTTLQTQAKNHGLSSKHGKHRDLSGREPIIRAWRCEGRTWAEIDGLLAAEEGRHAFRGGAYIWARKHAPELTWLKAGSLRTSLLEAAE